MNSDGYLADGRGRRREPIATTADRAFAAMVDRNLEVVSARQKSVSLRRF
jgi:hypothetical protein